MKGINCSRQGRKLNFLVTRSFRFQLLNGLLRLIPYDFIVFYEGVPVILGCMQWFNSLSNVPRMFCVVMVDLNVVFRYSKFKLVMINLNKLVQ